jgi:hypothetical protein
MYIKYIQHNRRNKQEIDAVEGVGSKCTRADI